MEAKQKQSNWIEEIKTDILRSVDYIESFINWKSLRMHNEYLDLTYRFFNFVQESWLFTDMTRIERETKKIKNKIRKMYEKHCSNAGVVLNYLFNRFELFIRVVEKRKSIRIKFDRWLEEIIQDFSNLFAVINFDFTFLPIKIKIEFERLARRNFNLYEKIWRKTVENIDEIEAEISENNKKLYEILKGIMWEKKAEFYSNYIIKRLNFYNYIITNVVE